MRVLLVLPAMGKSVNTHLGLAQLAACLRRAGHEVALLKINRPVAAGRFLAAIRSWAPRLVGFTAVSNHWHHVADWCAWLRAQAPDIVTCAGGPHVSVVPQEAAATPGLDLAVVGEGEGALVEVADRLQRGEDAAACAGIPGVISCATGGAPAAPPAFIQDLDGLPLPDRSIFGPNPGGDLPVMAGRGCPFDCTYCCNHVLRDVQPGKYVRLRSPARVLAEITRERARRRVRRVVFEDDTFTLRRDWLLPFLERYQREVGIPFVCNARVGNFDAACARVLKHAGCDYVCIGVESGCEQLRREVLGRRMTNAQIIEAFDAARREGLDVYAFYMLGFPRETAQMARRTLELHERLQPAAGFQVSVFYPYPRTRLWEIACEEGMIDPGGGGRKESFEGGVSTLRLRHMTAAELLALYREFERRRLESSFADRYLRANHPWALTPVRVLGRVFDRARLLSWARVARARLAPSLELHASTYTPEGEA